MEDSVRVWTRAPGSGQGSRTAVSVEQFLKMEPCVCARCVCVCVTGGGVSEEPASPMGEGSFSLSAE